MQQLSMLMAACVEEVHGRQHPRLMCGQTILEKMIVNMAYRIMISWSAVDEKRKAAEEIDRKETYENDTRPEVNTAKNEMLVNI